MAAAQNPKAAKTTAANQALPRKKNGAPLPVKPAVKAAAPTPNANSAAPAHQVQVHLNAQAANPTGPNAPKAAANAQHARDRNQTSSPAKREKKGAHLAEALA